MKIKLILLFVLFCFAINAQKQIQPYTFTNKTDKERTIRIYALAKTANDITFTLKNDQHEVLKIKKEDKIVDNEFSVSPFTEIVFRNKLIEAISKIYEEGDDKENENLKNILGSDIKNINYLDDKSVNSLREIRNIYQFFNALIITAFQYDTEPIAGTLKYNLEVDISKEFNLRISNLIKNLSRKRLWQYDNYNKIDIKKDTIIFSRKFKKGDTIFEEPFLNYLLPRNKDKIIEYGYEERKAIRRLASILYLDNFELENQKVLKKLYHEYEIIEFHNSGFIEYIDNLIAEKVIKKEIKELGLNF